MAFGTGKAFSYLDINAICHALGQSKSLALPFFHCFTVCDTTSGFFGKGKKLAWQAWKCYPDVTTAFTHMARNHTDSQYFRLLGRYTVVLYDKTSELDNVDTARMELFCHGKDGVILPWQQVNGDTRCPFAAFEACSISSWYLVHQ